jgi:ribosome biogenesis GTPase
MDKPQNKTQGRIIRAESGHFIVQTDNLIVPCRLRGRIKKEKLRRKRNVVVGDIVKILMTGPLDAPEREGVIEEVLPRRNMLSRLAAGKSRKEQILMANLDLVFLVMSVREPVFSPLLLDRFLAAVEHRKLEARICLNKCDLDPGGEAEAQMEPYLDVGYRVHFLSALEEKGLAELKESMRDKVSLFLGPSGAGKSTLLTTIQPGLKLARLSVSRGSGMGRHTTTRTELHALDFGAYVADSPGVREFWLWDVNPRDLAACFPEFHNYLGECRFPDCSHSHEPQCAVLEAVAEGKLDAERHRSYLRILEELNSKDSKF